MAPERSMNDKLPTDTSWPSRLRGSLTSPGVDEYYIPRERTLKLSESGISETVSSITDQGLSLAPSPFEEVSASIWRDKDMSGRLLAVRRVQALSIEVFQEWLYARFLQSALDKNEYLPFDAFEELFDMDSLIGLVKASFPDAEPEFHVDMLNEIIGGSRRKVFGILVAMDGTHHLQKFVQECLCDDDLPFRKSLSNTRHFTTQVARDAAELSYSDPVKAIENTTLFSLDDPKKWSRNEIRLFYDYQQVFTAPYFHFKDINVCYYAFDHNVTLPWEEYGHKTEGGEGIVHKVRIHPSHHNYEGSSAANDDLYFAVKEIPTYNVDRFRQELEALQKDSHQTQTEKHLIKLHLTFRHRDRLYLLFEWATSNLAEFWEKHPRVQISTQVTCWIALQCQGLARAVKRIHGLATWQVKAQLGMDNEKTRGRHGDIKPNNILWFEQREDDYNLLVLSDLGLTRYHSQLTNSYVSRIDGCTTTYRAPEVDMRQRISQRYDIWSLGCVFLEFCVWYLRGQAGLERFEDDRQQEKDSRQNEQDDLKILSDHYYTIRTCGKTWESQAKVKQVVHELIKDLIKEKTCPEFIRKLLKFIRRKMLIIQSQNRARIDEVCTELARIMPKDLTSLRNMDSLFTILDDHEDDKQQLGIPESEIALRDIGTAEILVVSVERHSLDDDVDSIESFNESLP
ncbi:hypothetical protein NW768_011242 [Fusarium equiseti]|uniref:Protein kinase domain-containing protein n=1 Tax=Fusarium equiseti TaxID=61235 RepID=A0ABQ8QXU0_FUSEQ|nr:hypothetical protein NW768_011242 [Fusarium equiseti]